MSFRNVPAARLNLLGAGMMIAATTIAPSVTLGETRVVPSISLSERYDSNVFFGLAGQGPSKDDYVTNVTPQASVIHKGDTLEGRMTGGFTAEAYANNPGLNYVGANGSASVILDRAVNRLVRNAKLQLTESFMYTPQLPAFLSPVKSEDPGSITDTIVRGQQAARANTFTITHGATGSYDLSRDASVNAGYTYTYLKFGNSFASPGTGGTFFNTHFQTATLGLRESITPNDNLFLSYVYSQTNFKGNVGGGISEFTTHMGRLGYTKQLTTTLTATVGGGLIYIGPPDKTIQYVGDASLSYRYDRTIWTAGYSRAVVPAISGQPLPLVSQTLTGSVQQPFTAKLNAVLSGNYAVSESTPTPIIKFTSIGSTLAVNYIFLEDQTTTYTISGSHSYQDYSIIFGGPELKFDRHVGMLTLKIAWK
ncbi:MAG: hypothetical protein HZB35_09620 [Nitrospirae bacterium]|nr:hypothetical protein [Nitrospirota bacterium]